MHSRRTARSIKGACQLILVAATLLAASTADAQTPRGRVVKEGRTASEGSSVVILGASYAKGWDLSLSGVTVVNRGEAGQQSFEMLARFDSDVKELRPRAVIVWGFINDVFRSPVDQLDDARRRIRESFASIVEKARSAGIEPILATEVTIRPRDATWWDTLASWAGWLRGKESYQDMINRHVLETNEWVREHAKRDGLLLLDIQPVLSDERNYRRREFSQSDGSHISDAGYRALTSYAQPVLQAHLSRQ